MSYDIHLTDPVTGDTILTDAKHHMAGGTYQLGGTLELWLNVTYNYSEHFYAAIDPDKGIRVIYGMTGAESIPILKAGIDQLGRDVDSDYWKATEGNVRKALCNLLAMAQMRPDGVWSGD